MLKDMAYNEFATLDKDPAHKDVLFDVLMNHTRVASQSKTFTQDWFAEFNANVASVFDGIEPARSFTQRMKPRLQALLDESIELSKEFSL